MNRHRSLIDSSRLAEILHRAGLGGRAYGDARGDAPSPPKVRFSEPSPAVSSAAEAVPPKPPENETRPPVPTFDPREHASLADRFEGLLRWVIATTRGETAFLADDDGLAMVDLGDSERMMSLSAVLGRVLSRASASVPEVVPSSVALEIRDGKHLQIVWAEGTQGRFALGILGAERLGNAVVSEVREQLRRTAGEAEAASG